MLRLGLRRALATSTSSAGTTAAAAAAAAGGQGRVLNALKDKLATGPSFADFLGGTPATAEGDVEAATVDDAADAATPIAPPGRPARTQYARRAEGWGRGCGRASIGGDEETGSSPCTHARRASDTASVAR